ncbi:MAG: HI0074 family nucleotidyltransferase substrate-binding subunit [Pseudobdellovibrionaceae bacterium]
MNSLSISPLQKALKNLKEALAIKNPTELERDGTVQRFEYSYELIWKFSQKILKENEIEAETPRNVFRELGRIGWINNVEEWFDFQKSRNETSHEYGEALAIKSYALAKKFYPLAEDLLKVLISKSAE